MQVILYTVTWQTVSRVLAGTNFRGWLKPWLSQCAWNCVIYHLSSKGCYRLNDYYWQCLCVNGDPYSYFFFQWSRNLLWLLTR